MPGIVALTMWRGRRHGAILFYDSRGVTNGRLTARGSPALRFVEARRVGRWWLVCGGGGTTRLTRSETREGLARMIYSVTSKRAIVRPGNTVGYRIFLGIVVSRGAQVKLAQGNRTWIIDPTADGYVLIGRDNAEPVIYAGATDSRGNRIGELHRI